MHGLMSVRARLAACALSLALCGRDALALDVTEVVVEPEVIGTFCNFSTDYLTQVVTRLLKAEKVSVAPRQTGLIPELTLRVTQDGLPSGTCIYSITLALAYPTNVEFGKTKRKHFFPSMVCLNTTLRRAPTLLERLFAEDLSGLLKQCLDSVDKL